MAEYRVKGRSGIKVHCIPKPWEVDVALCGEDEPEAYTQGGERVTCKKCIAKMEGEMNEVREEENNLEGLLWCGYDGTEGQKKEER